MLGIASGIFQTVTSSLYAINDMVETPSRPRNVVNAVALIALSAFAIIQNESTPWWCFAVGIGMVFNKFVHEHLSKDMAKWSWKYLGITFFFLNATMWPTWWKVQALLTGLDLGARLALAAKGELKPQENETRVGPFVI